LAVDIQGASLKLKDIPGLIGDADADPTAVVDLILAQLGLNAAPVGAIPPSHPVPLNGVQRDALIVYATDNGEKPTLNLKTEKTNDAVVKVRGLISLALQTAENQIF
jgi:hypothetical protein